MITSFIFDLDGVITDTAEFHFKAWSALANKLDIPFSRDDNEQLKGVDRMGSLQFILDKSDQSFSETDKQALADEKNTLYQSMLDTMQPSDIFPGARELLEQLRARDFNIALASASKNARRVLDCLQITDAFDYIVDAANVRYGKPDPETFLTAAQGLKVAPLECVGIEDAQAGLESIIGAGMHSVGIGDAKTLKRAELVYPSIAALNLNEVLALGQSS
ncbi:Beta-phosphoglucomutase [Saliniradius amylolyticus]|uniref:Beta-phosphoglucomutase n=1 Tax=Saliniradius amylolyticus TaxID=2183582 RepID=A0A2S2E5N7_9ALTE|nr:beta-phosphoglucomutase [Saliniradius amylolyticus]AWL12971.1 Beta-phosphoglucomutase [Saliniradius amylolyticus]